MFSAPPVFSLCSKLLEDEAMSNEIANEERERKEGATDSRTLEDIEDEEKTSGSHDNAPALSPDDGPGAAPSDNAGNPM
jgi:hypothetical protein